MLSPAPRQPDATTGTGDGLSRRQLLAGTAWLLAAAQLAAKPTVAAETQLRPITPAEQAAVNEAFKSAVNRSKASAGVDALFAAGWASYSS
jgi:hypothetical protein